jgi:hypothetical protein
MVEIWETTHCSCNYQVSNMGNVRRITGYGGEGLLDSPRPITPSNDRGYMSVMFSDGEEGFTRILVHILMMNTFQGKTPKGKVITHKNGDRSDNRLDNLEYTTRRDVLLDSYRTGLKTAKKDKNPNRKLTVAQVSEIRNRYKDEDITQAELGRQFGVTRRTICHVINNQTWS